MIPGGLLFCSSALVLRLAKIDCNMSKHGGMAALRNMSVPWQRFLF